jgi:hypothetical protein
MNGIYTHVQMELEIIMLSKVSQVQRDKSHIYMWTTDPKNKCIHKYKHDYTYTYFIYTYNVSNSGTV